MLLDWKNVMKGGIIGPTLVYFKHYTFITRDIASVLIYYMRLVQSPKDRHFISQACVFASSNNSTRSSGFETPRDGKYVPGWQWLVQWRWRKHPKVQVAPSRPLSSYCAVRQACYPQNTEQLLECMPIKTLEMPVCYTLTYRNWRARLQSCAQMPVSTASCVGCGGVANEQVSVRPSVGAIIGCAAVSTGSVTSDAIAALKWFTICIYFFCQPVRV